MRVKGYVAIYSKFLIHFPVQLIDITGKDQDESMIALHDCNGDVNRAINVLLEGSPDTVSLAFVSGLSCWQREGVNQVTHPAHYRENPNFRLVSH